MQKECKPGLPDDKSYAIYFIQDRIALWNLELFKMPEAWDVNS